ncbi:AsmA-like C-terminal region-containing protein [Adhaeribacter pallidiroseus]|uniref:Uncharacterized protein n=1 Tax=Adhaeribacter pallidiroseus TaxID=2072847 RepID=A0A369QF31_9BACT|nr:AsmA-like C-terminal region-containing protein [Adhaeribacter pallidiroseus]RDC62920.1 hypothetical protein AHMF7616_01519 [Adhaeribacter pallidiroseus]
MRLNVSTKKYIFIFLILFGILSIAFEVIARIYQQKATSYIRTRFQLQSNLILAPFTTSFSIWKHFPRATFTFHNLSLVDASGPTRLEVAAVKHAEIILPLTQFNLHHIKVARVVLNDFMFHQVVDENGNKNGLRFRKIVNPDTTSEKLLFRIKNVVIHKGRLISVNRFKKSAYAININQTKLAVERTKNELLINGNLDGVINYYATNQRKLYQNQTFVINGHYKYQLQKKQGTIYQTQALINNSQIHISGTHSRLTSGEGSYLNISMAGYQPVLPIFRQIMPPTVLATINKLRSNSRVYLIGRFQGESGPRLRPRSTVKFRLNNGEFYLPGNNKVIQKVVLAGILDNGPQHLPETSRLWLSRLNAQMGKGFVQMQVDLKNFTKPAFTIQGKGQLDLPELAQILTLPLTQAQQGLISGNLKISGVLPDSLRGSSPVVNGQGEIQIKQATFQPNGFVVLCRNVNGKLLFSDKDLRLQNLGGQLAGKSFNLNASIQNYLPFLFGQPGLLRAKVDVKAAALHADWLQGNLYAANSSPESPAAVEQNSGMYRRVHLRTASQESYRLVNHTTSPKKAASQPKTANSGVNRVLQSLLQTASSQVNVQVGVLSLTNKEALHGLQFQVNQLGQRVTLSNMHFSSADGGKATAQGGFRLTKAGIRSPYLIATLHYNFFNLQTFMLHLAELKSLAPQTERSARTSKQQRTGVMPQNDFYAQLRVSAQQVQYEYLHGSDLILRVNLNKNRAQLTQLSLKAFGGQINSHGNMLLTHSRQRFPLRLQAKVTGINLQQLFVVANQMNMDVLRSENIRGEVECHVALVTELDQTFSPSFDRTAAYANATFRNMELIEVTPIQNALRFLRKERVQHLYFDDVTTQFVMQNNRFITPKLRMNSNLTDFELSGKYEMRGGADLNMDINVLNVLFGNNKRRIEKIQDSVATESSSNMQHLVLTRQQDKYKVKLSNKKDRLATTKALQEEFINVLRQNQLDTLFTLSRQ